MRHTTPFYIAGLDGFRALAVLVVIGHHYDLSELNRYLAGGFGVEVFFFLSGYLISSLLLREEEQGGVVLHLFWLRRLVRLWPAMAIMLFSTAAVWSALGNPVSGMEMVSALLYFFNYYWVAHFGEHVVDMWAPLWSLCVEEHYYLLFPLLLLFTKTSLRLRYAALAMLLIGPLLLRFWNFYVSGYGISSYYLTETRIDAIAWGCLLGLQARNGHVAWFNKIPWWVIGAVAVTLVWSFLVYDKLWARVLVYSVHAIQLYILFGCIYHSDKFGWLLKALEQRVVRSVGYISYELYLWHMPVWYIAQTWFEDWRLKLVSLLATFLLAWLTYIAVDKPLVHVRRKLRST